MNSENELITKMNIYFSLVPKMICCKFDSISIHDIQSLIHLSVSVYVYVSVLVFDSISLFSVICLRFYLSVFCSFDGCFFVFNQSVIVSFSNSGTRRFRSFVINEMKHSKQRLHRTMLERH